MRLQNKTDYPCVCGTPFDPSDVPTLSPSEYQTLLLKDKSSQIAVDATRTVDCPLHGKHVERGLVFVHEKSNTELYFEHLERRDSRIKAVEGGK